MTNRVNAVMNSVQPTLLRSLGNRISAQPNLFKLPQRDHSVLTRRDLS